ncbi:acyltransferase domain-containing protein [Actinomadura terrae]|uniref:acyltransferase domain-containing protein n=1 Tax=Actinomadura terrae TaxID=604353 RepID=UPI001FA742E7|nr:acyltransferase domain-containing protein [Actinomadura terrae]
MTNEVWVFSGHGSQWSGMGRRLLEEAAFAEVVDVLEPVFAREIGFSPRAVLTGGDLGGVDRVQSLIFAMQVGLAALLRDRGAAPAAVIGHSVGEVAAVVTGGALSLEEGARLVCRRSTLLRRAAGKGAMVMVALPFAEVEARLRGRADAVAAIAAAPAATVVAGRPRTVDALIALWRAEGVGTFRVRSDVAFHSPHMDPLLDDLVKAGADLRPRNYAVPVYSTVLPDPRTPPAADGAYWAANLRNPVRLVAAVTAAVEDGLRSFLEVSPHPVVTHSISRTLAELGVTDGFVSGTLRRHKPEAETLDAVLNRLADRAPRPAEQRLSSNA